MESQREIAVYELSRREASEARAILRMVVRQKILTLQDTRRACNLTGAIIAMLVSASKSVEAGKGR